jgi:GT2 family glycosyltransferase
MDALLTPPPALRPAPPRAPARPRLRTARPRLSVVVVNYHTWPDTARLVRQLRAAPCLRDGAAEVVVVDNFSPAHPAAARLRRLTGVSVRRWRRNRGFARAVNEGCRLGRGDWFLLLNPDVTLPPGFLDAALERAERLADARPEVGVVGFRLENPDGSRQLSTGPFPTLAGTLARLLLPRAYRKYSRAPGGAGGPVDWATGCCLLIRRRCWDQLNGLDPGFFLYYEDVDLCRRARARGWSVHFEPGLSLVHHQPLHGRSVPPHLRLITRHALLTYAGKHWPAWQYRLLGAIVRVEARCRQARAHWRGERATAAIFGELAQLTSELMAGRPAAAARRLDRVVRWEEECRAAGAVGRRPQP